jgi:hypothetical protein
MFTEQTTCFDAVFVGDDGRLPTCIRTPSPQVRALHVTISSQAGATRLLTVLADTLPGLEVLRITKSPGLDAWPRATCLPPGLREIAVVGTRIACVPDLRACAALESVDLHDNHISSLPITGWLPAGVRSVDVSFNKVRAVDDYDAAFTAGVVEVDLSYNFLTEAPPAHWAGRVATHHNDIDLRTYCRGVLFSADPVTGAWTSRHGDVLPIEALPETRRVTTATTAAAVERRTRTEMPGVYLSEESVHMTSVQLGASDAIEHVLWLAQGKPQLCGTALVHAVEGVLFYRRILFGLLRVRRQVVIPDVQGWVGCTSVHSRSHVTFEKLLGAVWAVVESHEHRESLRERVREELTDAASMCFTGRMTRLVNALQGIVEGVHVGVSGREQLQARVAVVMAHPDAPGSRDQLLAALDDAAAVLASGEREAWLSAFDDARA